MDHAQQKRAVARGVARWQAPRLKPQVKKRGIVKRKKSGKTAVERELSRLERQIAREPHGTLDYTHEAASAAQAANREEALRAAQSYGTLARRGEGRALE